jgi:DNA-binding YbaB/EbfC family protein
MNLQQMMKQAQQMQEKLQKQMEATIVDATAGGGMVSVKMNGQKQLLSIQIDQEVFTSGDKDMLQDLIVAAVNEGIRKVDETMQSQLGSLAGGLKIPGLF